MIPSTHLALWSGPRNISTALMRSFESRPGTKVCDEPLYAHYLLVTGLNHPGRDEILAHHESDWRAVVDELVAPLPPGTTLYYQKHMAHHLLPAVGREWLEDLTHAFLIREPAEMLTSLMKILPRVRVEDTGLPQQVELFEHLTRRDGTPPPVIDARDVLEDPRAVLAGLCARVGLVFDERMLAWEAGPRASDGIWAEHWYASVERTTGFGRYQPKGEPVPDELADVHEACQELYTRLHTHRIRG